jgi:hypothetical protein
MFLQVVVTRWEEMTYNEFRCDPDVTHDISSVESDVYASATASVSKLYIVDTWMCQRVLIIDGRDSFGANWESSMVAVVVLHHHHWQSAVAVEHSASTFNSKVSLFDISNHNTNLAVSQLQQQHITEQISICCCRSTT